VLGLPPPDIDLEEASVAVAPLTIVLDPLGDRDPQVGHGDARGVPEVDQGGDQQIPVDGRLRCVVACLPRRWRSGVVWSFVYLALRRAVASWLAGVGQLDPQDSARPRP
jgi:hypothetical protein